ncbi:MAG: glycosyltransferase family 39 protein [Cyanobacteria bacterium P01_H01_bin.74]
MIFSRKISSSFWPGRFWSDLLILVLVCGIFFFWQLGNSPLFDLDEPRYAEAAREMLENGNWITPYFNYELRFDKPIFFYWLIALSYQWFGVTEFAARFFSAVAASITVFALYGFGRFWLGRSYGLLAAVMLSCTALFIGLSRMSVTDMTLTCWMTLTSLSLFLAARVNLKWWLAAGFFSGLAVLTKGPVGIVLPGAILLIYSVFARCFVHCFFNRWFLFGLLLCGGLSLPWYVAAYLQNGPIFLDALFKHNVTRFSGIVSGHKQPAYFYYVVLLVGALPWTVYLPALIYRLSELFRNKHLRNTQNMDRHAEKTRQLMLYALVWAIFTFVFFNVSATKLLTYILPMLPPVALLFAETINWLDKIGLDKNKNLDKKLDKNKKRMQPKTHPAWRWTSLGLGVFFLASCIGAWLLITNMALLLPREAAGIEATNSNTVVAVVFILGLLPALFFCSQKKAVALAASQIGMLAVVILIATTTVLPVIGQATQGTMLHYLSLAQGKDLILYEIQRPSLTFYGQRKIHRFSKSSHDTLQQYVTETVKPPATPVYIITKTKYVSTLSKQLPKIISMKTVEQNQPYRLLLMQPNVDKTMNTP